MSTPPIPPLPDANLASKPPALPTLGGSGELPGDTAELNYEGGPVVRHGGFFQHPLVQNVLPLATSLIFHIVLIVVGIVTYKAVQKVVTVVQEQIIVPESTLAENTPGGIPHPGLGEDPTRDAAQDIDKTVPPDSQSWATKASDNLNQAVAGASGDSDASVIGVGANTAIGGKGTGGLTGGGDGSGSLAPFGVPGGGGGMGPKSSFLGLGGNARKVTYFCDASGSMLTVLGALKVELKKSIDGLKPVQSFNIVFFSDANVNAFSNTGMVLATPDIKRKAYDFIDNEVTAGGTEPLPAIKFAVGQKPDLMYVLTDGFDNVSNPDDVANAFGQNNSDHKMKINCIFLEGINPDPKLVDLLQRIAKENGGLMKKILKVDF